MCERHQYLKLQEGKVNTLVKGTYGIEYKQPLIEMIKTILLVSLIVMTFILTQQGTKAATWNSDFEKWAYQGGTTNLASCIHNLNTYPLARLYTNETNIRAFDAAFKRCDNDMLILKLDVCPKHNNTFPVCTAPGLRKYVHDRGLDSNTTAPMEWWDIKHPELAYELNVK